MNYLVQLLRILTLIAAVSGSVYGQSLISKFRGENLDDQAGFAVAVHDDVAVIGARWAHGFEGLAYVLRRDSGGGWPHTVIHPRVTVLVPAASPYNEDFGFSVAINGSLIVVGQPGWDSSSLVIDNGAASVYRDTGTGLTYEGELVPTSVSGARTGKSVTAHGDLVALGAPGRGAPFSDAGHVYVYRRTTTVPHWGAPEAILTDPSGAVSNGFGSEVAVHGAVCIVGAPSDAGNSGAVYAFVRDATGTWIADGELIPATPLVGAYFGGSVDLDGDNAIVGSSGEGAAYVFRRVAAANWVQVARLEGPTGSVGGDSVAIDSGRAVVGDMYRDAGHVFRRLAPGEWVYSQLLLGGSPSTRAGHDVDIDGTTVVLGAPEDDEADPWAGAALFFKSPKFVDALGFGVAGLCPCDNDAPFSGCANSTYRGAFLSAGGTNSVAADGLELAVNHLPASKACVLLIGDGLTSLPLGSGLKIVANGGGGFARIAVGTSTAAGTLALGPGLGAAHEKYAEFVNPSETWNFQVWYRDAPWMTCTARNNTTNAVSITFAP